MAKPVKETPVLRGEDARRFERAINQNPEKPVRPEAYDRAMEVYRKIKRV